MQKAKEFAIDVQVPPGECEFTGGWLDRFKACHGIVCKIISIEANSVDSTSDDYQNWQVDETAIFFKALLDKTLEFSAKPCHSGKTNKKHLTELVCANMSGTEKMPLHVLGRSKNPRCFKHVKKLPVVYNANKKVWMTSIKFTEWVPNVDEQYMMKGRKITIIVDNCPAHPEVKNLTALTLVLPPNMTSVLQPMDQGII
ncbi:TIGD4-like protein [Mya arenaria]|uniref:TIGD4-like protein n=1 Tax=Mya arenaria TaxID=6604 RepID=A0ABY7E2K3_MYAAR|nr:TIGD4-like protein [Mya arenaria]